MTAPTAATVISDIRAACRQRLVDTTMPSVTILSNTVLSSLDLTAADEAGLDLTSIVKPGEYIAVSGVLANATPRWATAVSADALRVDTPFTADNAAGLTVSVPLPQIAWEGESFTPDPTWPFIAETFRVTSSETSPMGGIIKHRMLLTLTAFFPQKRGTLGIETMVGRLQERFRPRTTLQYGVSNAVIEKCEPRPLLHEPEWIQCAVTAVATAWTLNQ